MLEASLIASCGCLLMSLLLMEGVSVLSELLRGQVDVGTVSLAMLQVAPQCCIIQGCSLLQPKQSVGRCNEQPWIMQGRVARDGGFVYCMLPLTRYADVKCWRGTGVKCDTGVQCVQAWRGCHTRVQYEGERTMQGELHKERAKGFVNIVLPCLKVVAQHRTVGSPSVLI
jgi:hypothetical protein